MGAEGKLSFAEVAVDAPIGPGRTLSYSIPPGMEVVAGQLVWVPLGNRPVKGIVFQLVPQPAVEQTRDILSAVGPGPLITLPSLQLARWISTYYLSSLYEAAALYLPPNFEGQVRCYLNRGLASDAATIQDREREILDHVDSRGEAEERELLKSLGSSYDREMRRLLRKGALVRRWELPRPKPSHRYEVYLRLPLSRVRGGEDDALLLERAPRQRKLYSYLLQGGEPITRSQANKEYGSTSVAALLAKDLAGEEWVRVERISPIVSMVESPSEGQHKLTKHQEKALSQITESLEGTQGMPQRHLLYGVTGSGKTEVYLRALKCCVSLGKQGIFLVPEIALTPQTVHRLGARFPGRVALLHSGLTARQHLDQWWGIKEGKYDVVVGPRSAIFAPVQNLGLVVMDEEHEWTYKQGDAVPRYHAREAALRRAEMAGAVFVGGSATPDVESYYRASQGEFSLHLLPDRIAPEISSSAQLSGLPGTLSPRALSPTGGTLARVEICDMREELKAGNRSIFSRALAGALGECLDRGEQTILFLNRRGSTTVVQCRDCGHTMGCRSCSTTLTYHSTTAKLVCHLCNRRSKLPNKCPGCSGERIRYLGLGTQRVVEELTAQIPGVRVLRWDRDAARTPQGHEQIMGEFLRGEAQVLVGTQMVAKGLHLPNVTLVGTVLADVGLNLPDFRAGERSFQLLCQVAGRAGRGAAPGRVIIQTYNPDNYAVQAAAAQDYLALYVREIEARRQMGNPPFGHLIRMVYMHTSPYACQREAQRLGRTLRRKVAATGITDVDVVGPAPANPERLRGRYRWHLVLRGWDLHSFLEGVDTPNDWIVDVDPVSML